MSGPVTDLGLILHDLTHSHPRDVDMLLVGPDGSTNAIVMSDAGGPHGVNDVDLLLDDEAGGPLPDSNSLSVGGFQPTNHDVGGSDTFPAPAPTPSEAVALSTFDGLDPNGTWSLYVLDDTFGDIGEIGGGWSLAITTEGPANAAPVAETQTLLTLEDTPLAIQLGANDTDGDPLTYAVVAQPAGGTLVCDAAGACTYTPGDGFTGNDSFTFSASDGTDTSAPATVTITVDSDALDAGDAVMSNGARTRSSGTLTCKAGNVFVLEMVLTQDGGASAEGRARGTCTGEEQRYDVILTTLPGSALVAGSGELCATLRSAELGARMAGEIEDSCHDVDVYLGSRSGI